MIHPHIPPYGNPFLAMATQSLDAGKGGLSGAMVPVLSRHNLMVEPPPRWEEAEG